MVQNDHSEHDAAQPSALELRMPAWAAAALALALNVATPAEAQAEEAKGKTDSAEHGEKKPAWQRAAEAVLSGSKKGIDALLAELNEGSKAEGKATPPGTECDTINGDVICGPEGSLDKLRESAAAPKAPAEAPRATAEDDAKRLEEFTKKNAPKQEEAAPAPEPSPEQQKQEEAHAETRAADLQPSHLKAHSFPPHLPEEQENPGNVIDHRKPGTVNYNQGALVSLEFSDGRTLDVFEKDNPSGYKYKYTVPHGEDDWKDGYTAWVKEDKQTALFTDLEGHPLGMRNAAGGGELNNGTRIHPDGSYTLIEPNGVRHEVSADGKEEVVVPAKDWIVPTVSALVAGFANDGVEGFHAPSPTLKLDAELSFLRHGLAGVYAQGSYVPGNPDLAHLSGGAEFHLPPIDLFPGRGGNPDLEVNFRLTGLDVSAEGAGFGLGTDVVVHIPNTVLPHLTLQAKHDIIQSYSRLAPESDRGFDVPSRISFEANVGITQLPITEDTALTLKLGGGYVSLPEGEKLHHAAYGGIGLEATFDPTEVSRFEHRKDENIAYEEAEAVRKAEEAKHPPKKVEPKEATGWESTVEKSNRR